MKVGDIGKFGEVLCTITKHEGGFFEVTTPHGTVLRAGFLYFGPNWTSPLSEEDMERFRAFEQDATARRSST